MKLSAKGVNQTAVRSDLRHWNNVRRRKGSGRRVPSQRKQRRLKRQAAFRRNNATRAERTLFGALKEGKLFGTLWRRQHVIDELIADFYCRHARLVVEIHPDGRKWSRQADVDYLNCQGFAVLRFTESEVLDRLEWVLELIRDVCHKQLRLATRRGRACQDAAKPRETTTPPSETAAETAENSPQEVSHGTRARTRWSRVGESLSRFLLSRLVSAVFGEEPTVTLDSRDAPNLPMRGRGDREKGVTGERGRGGASAHAAAIRTVHATS